MADHKGKKIGKYVLLKEIGKGQFGTVYMAQSDDDQAKYAVKCIEKKQIDKNPMLSRLLKTEVGVMKQIHHPNIMHLFDFLESPNNYYQIMQFCNNGDVEDYMRKKGLRFYQEGESIYFLKQIMCGFQEQHKHKIMHRDFKLANIFVNDDTFIIGDFGFAKSGFEMAQTKLGTPLTMAPELHESSGMANYTSKADLWSIGIVFYQLLFGDPPFYALTNMELLNKIKKGSGNSLKIRRDINNISAEAEDILKKLLQEKPEHRIEWNDFFKHPIFKNETKTGENIMLLGEFLGKNNDLVDNNFNDVIKQGFADEQILNPNQLDVQDTAIKVNEEGGGFNQKWNNSNFYHESTELYKENAFRYFHEKNKILFIFLTVKQLRQIMKKTKIFGNHADSIYIQILLLAKKGIILSELNVMSLKKGNNIFNLASFEDFINTENCNMAIRSLLEDQPSLFEYFNYLKNKLEEVKIKSDDAKMINSLNEPYVYLPTLDANAKTKYDELRDKGIPNNLPADQRHEYLLVLVYALYAIKSEPHFPYNENGKKFEWETFRQRHEGMNEDQLRQLIKALNS